MLCYIFCQQVRFSLPFPSVPLIFFLFSGGHPLSSPVAQTILCCRKWACTLCKPKIAKTDWLLSPLFLLYDRLLDLSISSRKCLKFIIIIAIKRIVAEVESIDLQESMK